MDPADIRNKRELKNKKRNACRRIGSARSIVILFIYKFFPFNPGKPEISSLGNVTYGSLFRKESEGSMYGSIIFGGLIAVFAHFKSEGKYCSNCGYHFSHSATKFCPGCKTNLWRFPQFIVRKLPT